jgi:hypothetical protein
MKTTQQKILGFIINTRDHVSTRRDIRMRIRHRPDFAQAYQDLLAQGLIAERGEGCRGSVKMVFITHRGLHPELYPKA